MEEKDWAQLSDSELLEEKKKLNKSKLFHALWIGFMIGVLIYGLVNWVLSPDKKLAFLMPMLILVHFTRSAIKKNGDNASLIQVLKSRGLLN